MTIPVDKVNEPGVVLGPYSIDAAHINSIAAVVNEAPLSPKAFGGGPDKTASQNKAAFQSALTAAHNAGGGEVRVGPGVWNYDNFTMLQTLNKVTLSGAGRQATMLRPSSNAQRFLYLTGQALTLRDFSVGPASLNPVRQALSAVEFNGSNHPLLENVEIFNSPGILAAFVGCAGARAVGNYVHDAKADGIHFVHCDTATVCDNNHVAATQDDGIAIWNYEAAEAAVQYGASVTGNLVDGTTVGGAGVNVGGSTGVAVVGNTTRSTVGPGVRVGKQAGFSTEPSKRCLVEGNIVESPFSDSSGGYAGIEVSEYNVAGQRVYNQVNEDIVVQGNIVRKSGNNGLEFGSVKRGVLSNNVSVDACSTPGTGLLNCMEVKGCTGLAVVGNVLIDTRASPLSYTGAYLEGLTDVMVTGNVLRGMINPNFVRGGVNTRLSIIGNSDNDNLALAGITPPKHNLGIEILQQGVDGSAPPSGAKIYVANVGGKSVLRARFPTGAIQQLAIEP